jgi:transcriptional regulator with XRE-family HTH domain
MPNERRRALLLERGQTPDQLAEAVHVDANTVERWITRGRVPYRKHRFDVATFLGVDEAYTWPDALGRDEVAAVSRSEVVAVWPHRWAVPRDTWGLFFAKAEREIGALVYSGMFMAEDIGVHRLFAERARAGVRVRLLLGDPDSPNVAERGAAEGSTRPWRRRSAPRSCCSGSCWPSRVWSCGCMAPSCTTRTTASAPPDPGGCRTTVPAT